MTIYKDDVKSISDDYIYVIGSYLPFEKCSPYDSETTKAFMGELMLLGYNEDYNIFKKITIYKINKSIVDDDIFNSKLKNMTKSNLKDPYIKKIIIKNIFSNIEESDKGNLSDNTKYINKFSVIQDGSMNTFYDMYSYNLQQMKDIAEILRDELILNIKAQIAIKNTLSISSNKFKKIIVSAIKFKFDEASDNISRVFRRHKLIKKLSESGDLYDFRDSYVCEYERYRTEKKPIEIGLDYNENRYKVVFILTDQSIRDFDEVYIVKNESGALCYQTIIVKSVLFKYYEKDNISIPTITGVVKSSDVDKDCLITIDFKYMMGMSEEGGYLFNDYELVTDDCVLNRVLKI